MLVEYGRAGEAVGDALDEPEGGEEVGRGAMGVSWSTSASKLAIPMPATSRLNQRSVVVGVDPSSPTVTPGEERHPSP
jgi:hypothetical protein